MIKQKRASPNCRPGWGRALLLLPLEVPRRVGCAGGIGRAWGEGGFLLYFCGFFGFVTLTYSSKNETGRSLKGKKTTINRACGTFTAPRGFITELPRCRCPEPSCDPSSPPGELVAKSWLGKGGGGSPFPQLLAGRILPCRGFPGQPGQRRKAELLCSKKNTGTFLGTGSVSLLSDGKKELEEANMKKAGEGWKDLGTARNGG